jgi:hypothetical protein
MPKAVVETLRLFVQCRWRRTALAAPCVQCIKNSSAARIRMTTFEKINSILINISLLVVTD